MLAELLQNPLMTRFFMFLIEMQSTLKPLTQTSKMSVERFKYLHVLHFIYFFFLLNFILD